LLFLLALSCVFLCLFTCVCSFLVCHVLSRHTLVDLRSEHLT